MGNLIEIQSQIEKLQKQANEIKTREFAKTVQEITAKMQAFGITAKDLLSSGPRQKKSGPVGTTKRRDAGAKRTGTAKVSAKYRGPNGETWSGRGLTPRWLATLVAEGKSKEDFAIKS